MIATEKAMNRITCQGKMNPTNVDPHTSYKKLFCDSKTQTCYQMVEIRDVDIIIELHSQKISTSVGVF